MAAAAPENTLQAMELAFQCGADAVEFDLRLSADGEVMVFHDATVDRTTDGTGAVASKTASELRDLNAAARFLPGKVEDRDPPPRSGDDGVPYPEYRAGRPAARAQIPFFREVLEAFSDRHLLIEIKDPHAAEPARAMIEQFAAANRCMIDSYSDYALTTFRSSDIPVGAGRDGVIRLLKSFLFMTNSRPDYDGMCVPRRYKNIPLPLGILSRIARRDRKTIHIWTINTRAEAGSLWQAGVNGIVTDDVRPILAQRDRQ